MIIAFMHCSPIRIFRSLLLALLLVPSAGWSFNAIGHRVVGHVAAATVCRSTATALQTLDPQRTIATAGLWADEIREESYWSALKPWHYMNIPDNQPLATASRNRRGDVLLAVEKFSAELADPATDELDRRIAYRLLVHFVADIHQPLHVGRKGDLGGNKTSVRVDGRRTNLHAYWDGYDLAGRVRDPRDYALALIARFAESVPDLAAPPADWAHESQALRPSVYALPPGAVPELGDSYREKYIEIIDLRLYQAGVRLARQLDAIYCSTAK